MLDTILQVFSEAAFNFGSFFKNLIEGILGGFSSKPEQ